MPVSYKPVEVRESALRLLRIIDEGNYPYPNKTEPIIDELFKASFIRGDYVSGPRKFGIFRGSKYCAVVTTAGKQYLADHSLKDQPSEDVEMATSKQAQPV